MNEDVFGDLLWDEPSDLNQCSDLIDELLLVQEMTHVSPGDSQCSVIVLPFAQEFCIKKEQMASCQEVYSF